MNVPPSSSHSEPGREGVDKRANSNGGHEKERCLWRVRFQLEQRGDGMQDGEGECFLQSIRSSQGIESPSHSIPSVCPCWTIYFPFLHLTCPFPSVHLSNKYYYEEACIVNKQHDTPGLNGPVSACLSLCVSHPSSFSTELCSNYISYISTRYPTISVIFLEVPICSTAP